MHTAVRRLLPLIALMLSACASHDADGPGQAPATLRVATYNTSLYDDADGGVVRRLQAGDPGARKIAAVLQQVRPDLVLLNEFDYDPAGEAADLFQRDYLAQPQPGGGAALHYPYRYFAAVNTGVPSGLDLDRNGTVGGDGRDRGDDAWGYGLHPGQYGMLVLSKYPIDAGQVRTFQRLRWAAMPGARRPLDPETGKPWHDDAVWEQLRLSSKSHWDVPVRTPGGIAQLLVSHPTPPVFDGPEDRNGLRNADEIRFWADYITPGRGGYIYDDEGVRGGLDPGSLFVIAGDQNSDPLDGDSIPGSAQLLLEHPLVNTKLTPDSAGAVQQAALQGGANLAHRSDPRFDTADFSDSAPGNLRADYVLPRKNLRLVDAGVFWPLASDPLFRLVGTFPFPTSDHRLVWVDATVPEN